MGLTKPEVIQCLLGMFRRRRGDSEVMLVLFLVVILLLFVVIFAVQNAQMVDIRFLIWSLSLNQALVVLGSLSIGLVLGAVWSWLKGAGVRGQVKELSRTLDAERRKVENLEKALEEERSRKREYESAQ